MQHFCKEDLKDMIEEEPMKYGKQIDDQPNASFAIYFWKKSGIGIEKNFIKCIIIY